MMAVGRNQVGGAAQVFSGVLRQLLAICALLVVCIAPAQADRQLPSGMLIGVVANAQYPTITLWKPKPSLLKRIVTLGLYQKTVSYPLSVAVRVREDDNRFIVYGQLPQTVGRYVGLKADFSGKVSQVWVLTNQEAAEYLTRPDTRLPN